MILTITVWFDIVFNHQMSKTKFLRLFFSHAWSFFFFFFKIYLFIFRQRGREGEKPQCLVASRTPPTGDLAHNPGLCPDWESNQQPFGLQAIAQSIEPHQPGQKLIFL